VGFAAECLLELFREEEETEGSKLRRIVGATLIAEAFEDIRNLRKAWTKDG
jgi:hypothetical protein